MEWEIVKDEIDRETGVRYLTITLLDIEASVSYPLMFDYKGFNIINKDTFPSSVHFTSNAVVFGDCHDQLTLELLIYT